MKSICIWLLVSFVALSCTRKLQTSSKLYRHVTPSGLIIYHTESSKHIYIYPEDFKMVQTKSSCNDSL